MNGMDACAVENLLAARGAGGRDDAWGDAVGFLYGLADGGEQHHLSNGQRGLVMLFLVAERPRHATATARDDMDLCIGQKFQCCNGLIGAY